MSMTPDNAIVYTAPGTRLSKILSREHAVSALIVLRHNPGIGVSKLGVGMGGTVNSGRFMAEHLRDHGLVVMTETPRPQGTPTYEVELTELGEEIAETLERLVELVPDAQVERKKFKR